MSTLDEQISTLIGIRKGRAWEITHPEEAGDWAPAGDTDPVEWIEQGGKIRLKGGTPPLRVGPAGLSLRDRFAGQALQGLCANQRLGYTWLFLFKQKTAYEIADAMITAGRELP